MVTTLSTEEFFVQGGRGVELSQISGFRDMEFQGSGLALALVQAAIVNDDDDRKACARSWRRRWVQLGSIDDGSMVPRKVR